MTDEPSETDEEQPPNESTERDVVRMRFPQGSPDPDEEQEYTVQDDDLIGIAWHENGAIGDALEVFPASPDDDGIALMRDILDDSINIYGRVFAVDRNTIHNFEFVTPDGEDISVEGIISVVERNATE